MELHPLAEEFASIADAYEHGRPDYRPAVVGALAAELGLGPGARVLDLAAGTGKLTRALVAAGLDIVAVEPLAELRSRLAGEIGGERVLDGVAEAIPLDDASVDAVTAADSFHWFDHARALREIDRVLRPAGGLAVLVTIPDWRGASWAHELGALIERLRPKHPFFDGPSWKEAVRAEGGWAEPREVRVTTAQQTNPGRIADYVGSMSFVAALPEPKRAEAMAEVRALLDSGEMPDELPVHVVIGLTRRA